MSALDHKLGPLKTWQWGLLGGGALLLYIYEKKKSETSLASIEQPATESFNTGNPSQSAEGSGSSGEQPTPLPPEPHQTETAPAPGLGAGQLFATEVGEVTEGKEALEKLGLVAGAPGKSPSTVKKSSRKATKGRRPGNHRLRGKAKPPHAKGGQHHHRKHQGHGGHSPHHGATHAQHHQKHVKKVVVVHGGAEAPSQQQAHHATHHHRRHKK